MKVSEHIKLLSELPPDEVMTCLVWLKEDIEIMLDTKLTDDEWLKCVDVWENTTDDEQWYWVVQAVKGEV